MHRLLKLLFVSLLFTALSAGANAADQAQAPLVPLDNIVAIVNNGVITMRQLQDRTAQIKAELQARGTQLPSAAELERQVLNSMILEKIQLGIAKLNGISIDDQTFNDALARLAQRNNLTVAQMHDRITAEGHSWTSFTQQIRDHLTIQKLQQRSVGQHIRVTEQEVRDFLAQHANQLEPGLQYHLAQILIPIPGAASPEQIKSARSEAEKLRKQAESGESFAKLAVAHSAGQHALKGGDLGWLGADQLPTYFVRVVNVMQHGDISQPIRSPSGFHLVKLLGVRGGKKVTITQTHVRHILIKITPTMSSAQARTKLERLRREIEQGASFATLAKANSDDTGSAANGGDLGWVSPGQMVPQFQKVMNETPVGKVSQPFRTPYGWHILEVLGRRQHDSTEQMVQARAKQIIFQRKRQEALNVWLRNIRDQAYVRILLKQNNQQNAAQGAG
ncbi:MAG: peptidylprolyl isomerase [Acidihalobacter sp.]